MLRRHDAAAEETLQKVAAEHGKPVATHLYRQEINAETFAIAKTDLLLKGEECKMSWKSVVSHILRLIRAGR